MSPTSYIIVTAARNEASYLERTLLAVTTQTVAPVCWVIVSDGSTDGTNDLVRRYAARFSYIRLVESGTGEGRNFGSKARAINHGYSQVSDLPHAFVAVLDADVSFDLDYYERVMKRFARNPKLGMAGGILHDNCGGVYIQQNTSPDFSVSGPIQMFRKSCFELIGGYHPLPRGGIDAVAETAVRMNGFDVRAFPELKVLHHRRTGAEKGNIWITCFRDGLKEYGYGCHPLFEIAKALARLPETPWVAGSLLRVGGYCCAWLRREPRLLPHDILAAIRREQRERLAGLFRKRLLNRGSIA
jgi:biofilm PGA synthesis N-glycosyltransferase PgaC